MTIAVHHPLHAPRRQVRVTRGTRIVHDTRPEDAASRSAAKEVRRAGCAHRGDVLRTETCRTCGGNVRVKVLACTVHGACTVTNKLPGLTWCLGRCDAWSPLLTLDGSLP